MPRKELRRVCLFPFFFFKASCFFSFSHIYCAQIGGSREFCIRLVEICYRCTFKRINDVSLPLLTGHLPAIRFLLSLYKMTTFLPVLLVVESGDRGGCIRTHAAIGVTWPHTLEKRQRERAAAGGWNTRLRLKEATVTSEIRRWRLQSASKHGVNKAQVRAECKQWEDEGEQEDELWEFVLHLLGRVSLQRQRPSLHSPLISPLALNLLFSDSDNDVQ